MNFTNDPEMAKSFWKHIPSVKEAQAELDAFHEMLKPDPPAKSILDTAKEVIYGDREATYGDPGKNLRVIADYWHTYLMQKGYIQSTENGLTAEDVCNMMVLLKIARLGNTPGHLDSLVDICGYTALQERVKNADLEAQEGADTSRP